MGKDRVVPHDFRRELLMELFDLSSKRCALAYHDIEADMSATESTCARFRERGINLTPLHLLVRASALTLKENPIFNSVMTRSGIRVLDRVAIGVLDNVPARL